MTKVLYVGSFDPITKGHMSIIKQALDLFDEVVIGIMINPSKKSSYFTTEERLEMIREIYKDYLNIKVILGEGATTDLAVLHDCKAIVRGLRGISDFDYEMQLAFFNKQISNERVNTICLFADNNFQYISSSAVKEILNLDKDISPYVDEIVKNKMLARKIK